MFGVGYFGPTVVGGVPQEDFDTLVETVANVENSANDVFYWKNNIVTPVYRSDANAWASIIQRAELEEHYPQKTDMAQRIWREIQSADLGAPPRAGLLRPFPSRLWVPNLSPFAVDLEGTFLLNRIWREFLLTRVSDQITDVGSNRAYWQKGTSTVPRNVVSPLGNVLQTVQRCGPQFSVVFAMSFQGSNNTQYHYSLSRNELVFHAVRNQSTLRLNCAGTNIHLMFPNRIWSGASPALNTVFLVAISMDLQQNTINFGGLLGVTTAGKTHVQTWTHTRPDPDEPAEFTAVNPEPIAGGYYVDFAEWGAGRFWNGTTTITTAPVTNWTTTGPMDWTFTFGGHPTSYASISDESRLHELRWYDTCLNVFDLTHAMYDVRDAVYRRTEPPKQI